MLIGSLIIGWCIAHPVITFLILTGIAIILDPGLWYNEYLNNKRIYSETRKHNNK